MFVFALVSFSFGNPHSTHIYLCEKKQKHYEPGERIDVYHKEKESFTPGEIISVEPLGDGQKLTLAVLKDINSQNEN